MAAPLVTLTVSEGNQVIHEGNVLAEGETFEISPKAAEALVANGGCELADGSSSKKGSGGSKEPSAKDIVAGLPELDDEELQGVLDAENERDRPRSTVIDGVEAEQAARAE